MAIFPTEEWLNAFMEKLNSDENYARIASRWEGDMIFSIEPSGNLNKQLTYYLDLWHGKCRDAYIVDNPLETRAMLKLNAPYDNYVRLLKGEIEPMQALLTRKINLKGNMAVLMRNVPTVLDFVRCAREVTDGFL